MHRTALAGGVTAAASGQFGHHAPWLHPGGKHVTMIAISGDQLITIFHRHPDAGDDRFLTNVQMAEPADETHAIELAGLFLEPANKQHVMVDLELLLLVKLRHNRTDRRFATLAGFGSR